MKKSQLAEAVSKVMDAVKSIQKTQLSYQEHGADYEVFTEDGLLEHCRQVMIDEGLVLLPTDAAALELGGYTGADGSNQKTILGRFEFELIHHPSGESKTLRVLGEDADSSSKRTAKAQTDALKTCLRRLFLIRSGNDPDLKRIEREPERSNARLLTAIAGSRSISELNKHKATSEASDSGFTDSQKEEIEVAIQKKMASIRSKKGETVAQGA